MFVSVFTLCRFYAQNRAHVEEERVGGNMVWDIPENSFSFLCLKASSTRGCHRKTHAVKKKLIFLRRVLIASGASKGGLKRHVYPKDERE